MRRILVVDSDKTVRGEIARHARLDGYEVVEAGDGCTAVTLCHQNAFDIMILAVMLDEMDGFSVCTAVRRFSQVPILMLSERGDETCRIHGLELGADDYMTKPFSPRELMLRISAILKRTNIRKPYTPQSIQLSGIFIDLVARRVLVDDVLISLTPKGFDLLCYFVEHPNAALTRTEILHAVWGSNPPESTRTLDTHIKQIRQAIRPYSHRIITLRGVGYRFETDTADP